LNQAHYLHLVQWFHCEAYCSDWWIIRHLVLCIDWIYLGRMPCSIVNHSDYFKGRGSTVFTLGCLDDLSRGSEFIQSHDRFVGFRSIRQKRHNYGAQ